MPNYPSNPSRYPGTANRYPATANRYPANPQRYPNDSVPLSISNMLVWLNADQVTDTGDGTAITAATDLSPSNCVIGPHSAGNGLLARYPSGRRSKKLIEGQSTTKSLQTTTTGLTNKRNGAKSDFTWIFVGYPTNANISYLGGWGYTGANTSYCFPRRTNLLVDDCQRSDPGSTFATVTLDTAPKGFGLRIWEMEYDSATNTVQWYEDGQAIGTPQTFTWNASCVCNIYTWGSLRTNTNSMSFFGRIRHQIVYGKKLSSNTAERQRLRDYLAADIGHSTVALNWKKGFTQSSSFGNGSNATLVVVSIGDSQITSYSTTSAYSSIYSGTTQQAYALYPDFTMAPIDGTTLVDPTDKCPGIIQDTAGGAGLCDGMARLADYLRDNGETRNIVMCNRNLGSGIADGTSGIIWVTDSGAGTPSTGVPYGGMYYYVDELIRNLPNVELVFLVSFGPAHAASPAFNGATVANLQTGMTTILDSLNTRYATYFAKTQHFFVGKPPVTQATGFEANWDAMRTQIDTFVAGRTDCVKVDYPNGPFDAVNTHLNTGSNTPGAETGKMGMAVAFGAAIMAAT